MPIKWDSPIQSHTELIAIDCDWEKMNNSMPLMRLVVIAAVAVATAYAQVTYPTTVIAVEGGGCPVSTDLQAALSQIKTNVRDILSNYTANRTYCGGTGGWNRIAFLDMTDPVEQCPSTWSEVSTTEVFARACGGVVLGDQTCDSSTFSNTDAIEYSQVCGRMVGYQLSAPDAFRPYHDGSVTTIDGPYLDGISLTHGPVGSRQHIWSFAVGENEDSSSTAACPCNNNATMSISIPPFVGENYFCESGVSMTDCTRMYFGSDPLWDGINCERENTCCDFNTPPYFTTTLPSPTADDLEVRLCSYDGGCISDVAVSFIELYVK